MVLPYSKRDFFKKRGFRYGNQESCLFTLLSQTKSCLNPVRHPQVKSLWCPNQGLGYSLSPVTGCDLVSWRHFVWQRQDSAAPLQPCMPRDYPGLGGYDRSWSAGGSCASVALSNCLSPGSRLTVFAHAVQKTAAFPPIWQFPFERKNKTGYLRNHLIHLTLPHPTWSGRGGVLWNTVVKEFQLAGSRKRAFAAVSPTVWNILP